MWWHRRGWNVVEAYAEAARRHPPVYIFTPPGDWIRVYAPHHGIDAHVGYVKALELARDLERASVHPKVVRSLRAAAQRIRGR